MNEQHSSKAVERFVFFSDAVFAFALTLLAVEVKLPAHEKHLGLAQLLESLHGAVPSFICYVISFWVVAALWKRHHRLFEHVRNYDDGLIRLNFVLLFCVSLTPFSIELITAAPGVPLTITSYCGLLAAIGFASFALWWKLQKTPGLVADRLVGRAFWVQSASELTMPVLSVAMAIAAYQSPENFSWLAATLGIGAAVVKRMIRRWVANGEKAALSSSRAAAE
jgi:uncharacterized membrane protein